jgi:hypothetical protein
LVYATPRASKTRAVGYHDGRVRIQLAAPPVDGEANAELARYIAKLLGQPLRNVTLVAGATSRQKAVEVGGVCAATAQERLEGEFR